MQITDQYPKMAECMQKTNFAERVESMKTFHADLRSAAKIQSAYGMNDLTDTS